jgi:hypothetical protein
VLSRPDHVRHADLGHAPTTTLNVRTGTWVRLDEDTRRIRDAALAGPTALRLLVDTVAARGHDTQQVHEAVESTVATLQGHGLLAPHPEPRRSRWWQVIPCR